MQQTGQHEMDRLRRLEKVQEINTTNIASLTTQVTAYIGVNDSYQMGQNGFIKTTAKLAKRNDRWLMFLSIGLMLHMSGFDLPGVIKLLMAFIVGIP